ncbi:MAG TPA: hypothetical protein VG826_01795 [Pirellulales bacterium]|nr:hypothetical protein [Pirellulales bacterium]
MPSYHLHLDKPRPYFAEIPYYVWGQVNYDSEGDCERPTDREWTCVDFSHRETNETLAIRQEDDHWVIEGPDPLAARAAYFLVVRCGTTPKERALEDHIGDWDHTRAAARAARVQAEFERPDLVTGHSLGSRDGTFWPAK